MANEKSGFYSDGHLAWMQKHGQALPYHAPHSEDSEENPLSKKLTRLKITNWTLEGNLLKGETEMGPFVQTISTDLILDGVDENNLPRFKKVVY